MRTIVACGAKIYHPAKKENRTPRSKTRNDGVRQKKNLKNNATLPEYIIAGSNTQSN